MYTLLNLQTSTVLATGLSRDEMVAAIDHTKIHVFTSDYTGTPEQGMRLNQATRAFEEFKGKDKWNEAVRLLQESDWRTTADYPHSDQAAWLTYRNSLRAILQDLTLSFPTRPITTDN